MVGLRNGLRQEYLRSLGWSWDCLWSGAWVVRLCACILPVRRTGAPWGYADNWCAGRVQPILSVPSLGVCISLTTKLKVYQAIVITTLLYACESCTVYSKLARQLNHFHITWYDILSRANMPSIQAENMMLKSVGASTQPCFTLFHTQKASDISQSSRTYSQVNVPVRGVAWGGWGSEDSGEDLAGYGQQRRQRYTPVIVTGLVVSFPFVKLYNRGILEVLGYDTLPPHGKEDVY